MSFICKSFDELTTRELYEILRARSAVFVVEQNCVYQDLDKIDYESIHIFAQKDSGEVTAYLRLFMKKDEDNTTQMGRVLTTERGKGLGGEILREGIRAAKEKLSAGEIYIEAQEYAIPFYSREGFEVTSDVFLEDGIPHVEMRLKF
ncbi:MAG: GNAT family N-acetyltransferase [Ruminococcus sp.]|nr:GNAT family N-acetyltransferase [Ruminococcus sp.]